jgi:UDP-2,4-diacetamido-2,4,6-trideoxy-beta-L-altropyranose hydrolase
VDGNGARRVVSALRDEAGVHLRRAREDDCKLLFDWANDIEVRSAAFSSAPITWESHVAWFSGKLHAGRSFIWIAEDAEGSAVGQIRFDIREDSEAEVDVSIARTRRGQGFAHALIRLGSNLFLQESDCKLVHAFVKETNDASARAFERAGFKRAGTTQIRGMTAIHFTYERS